MSGWTIRLATWMRLRGHRWREVAEASAVSHLPVVALLVPLWAGGIGAYAVLGRTHPLAVPAMAPAVLLRPVEDVR